MISWVLALFFLGASANFSGAAAEIRYGSLRNGSFSGIRQCKPDDPDVLQVQANGWKLPKDLVFPSSWGPNPNTPNGSLEYFRSGGFADHPFLRLGGGGHIASFFGPPEPGRPYVAKIQVRGKGTVWFGAYCFSADVQQVDGGPPFIHREIDSEAWREYKGLFLNNKPEVQGINLFLAGEGQIDVGEVAFSPAEAADVEMVREMAGLYGTGALIEDVEVQAVKADDEYRKNLADFETALKVFQENRELVDKSICESLTRKVLDLEPYVKGQEKNTVLNTAYNEMIVLTRVLNRLAGKEPGKPVALKTREAVKAITFEDCMLGMHKTRKDTVTITNIKPNKILYEEGEEATAAVTLANTSSSVQKGTLVALQYVDLDIAGEVARGAVSIEPGGATTWTFKYNVGTEMYGRAIEVRFIDDAGTEIDRWQEYYQVAREWLRVQMHTAGRYNNMGHYFASEPTDWGIQPTDAEEWISAQAGYQVCQSARQYSVKSAQEKGKKFTFYQNCAFAGIMGYEEMRKHPEYVLYDKTGQFGVDPVYGGYPNPMEIASPIETGPKRAPRKPYLDRKYTPYAHASANYAMEDAIEYGARCIREYSKLQGFDGVYIDGSIFVTRGYGYDGKINIPEDRKEIALLNARIQNLYHRILKEDNPCFGTWYNLSLNCVEWLRSIYGSSAVLGAGVGDDVGDEWIRAMNGGKNVTCLMEWQATLNNGGDDPSSRPKDCLNMLCENRDYIVQKYGGNVIVGYLQGMPISKEKPGPARWGWSAINYFMGQIIASQYHVVLALEAPSLEPSFQFQTRYSRFLWAPDIKVVPEAEKVVTVETPEELLWKQLVYRRDTKDGYDLIIHLVRIPPTERWDVNFLGEPVPLSGISIAAEMDKGVLQGAYACRPYYFEEKQQVVQEALKAEVSADKATVRIPPFRYYTMIVLHVKK